MKSVSTIGDIGIGVCCCHNDPKCIPMVGVIVSGSTDVYIENKSAARTGDIVIGGCGHIGILIGSSNNISIDSVTRHKIGIGDMFVGCFTGTIVTGYSHLVIS